jgi:hypothetical protein
MTRVNNRNTKAHRVAVQPPTGDTILMDAVATSAANVPRDEETSATGQPILYVAALISLTAAFIHLLVIPEHFGEWWGYGVFFVVAAAVQTLFALVLLRRPSSPVLLAGIVGNLAIVAVWIVSRTVGVPFFGPGAGEIEEIGAHDIIATAAEIALIVLLAYLLQARQSSGTPMPAEA